MIYLSGYNVFRNISSRFLEGNPNIDWNISALAISYEYSNKDQFILLAMEDWLIKNCKFKYYFRIKKLYLPTVFFESQEECLAFDKEWLQGKKLKN